MHGLNDAGRKLLVVATSNPGKVRELCALLDLLPFQLVAQGDLGVVAPAETGSTFLANAILKARHAASVTGAAAIADDSGLEVDALDGAPGIFSARYAGIYVDDEANNAKLLRALAGVAPQERHARYRCAVAFVSDCADEQPLTGEGVWHGMILDMPRGAGGFGYDRHFWLPELGRTAAELSSEEKNRHSHRGMALRALRALLVAREAAAVAGT